LIKQRLEYKRQYDNHISSILERKGITMFEGLQSKFKKSSSKDAPKIIKTTPNKEGGKSGNVLMFVSIGLIVLGAAGIAFEYVTTSASPMPQPSASKQPLKPATLAKPASAPAAASANK
jgi:hypothetical protein